MLLSDGGREARDEMIERAVVKNPARFSRSILNDSGAELEEQDGERKKKKGERNPHPLLWDCSVGIEASAEEQHEKGSNKQQNKKERSKDYVSKGSKRCGGNDFHVVNGCGDEGLISAPISG